MAGAATAAVVVMVLAVPGKAKKVSSIFEILERHCSAMLYTYAST